MEIYLLLRVLTTASYGQLIVPLSAHRTIESLQAAERNRVESEPPQFEDSARLLGIVRSEYRIRKIELTDD